MIPTAISTGDLLEVSQLPYLREALALVGTLILGEFAISYALDRIKWKQQLRWPLAVAGGLLVFVYAWRVLPALGVRSSALVLIGWAVLAGHVFTRYRIWPVFWLEYRSYKTGRRVTGWTGRLQSTYDIEQFYYRPLALAVQLYALVVGGVRVLHATASIQLLPAAMADWLQVLPSAESAIFGVIGIVGGTIGGMVFANRQIQEAIAQLEPPSKRGKLACAGRVAAADTSLARRYREIKTSVALHAWIEIDRLPDDAPISPDDLGLTSLVREETDYSRFPTIDAATGGKAAEITRSNGVMGALAFEYVDADDEIEPDSPEPPDTVRFTRFAVRPDCLGVSTGHSLVEYVMWDLGADHYLVTVDNPFDYQALYELGFAYTGETTPAGVELERPGPVLADEVPSNDSTNSVIADKPTGERGYKEAVADGASIDRTPEPYRAGLRSFLDEDGLAATLSADARTFIDDHRDLDPPIHQSGWQQTVYRKARKASDTDADTDTDTDSAGGDSPAESAPESQDHELSTSEPARHQQRLQVLDTKATTSHAHVYIPLGGYTGRVEVHIDGEFLLKVTTKEDGIRISRELPLGEELARAIEQGKSITVMAAEPTGSAFDPDRDPPSNRLGANRYTEEQLAQGHYDWQYADVTFADIGGYAELKQVLANGLMEPLRAAASGDDRFERFGIEPERGILFYGPPGTGKTLFARALAGELGVPFVELSPADVTSKWINEGPQLVQRLFDEAAQLGPCVIFLDEAEHLFGARDTGGRSSHAEDTKITSEFLVHLTSENREAIVVSATNRPGDIDPAVLRSGRLARHIEIGLPDEDARQAILETHLEGAPSALARDDHTALAAHTRGFTGADLETLVDRAKRAAALRDAPAVTLEDFPSFEELDEIVDALEHEPEALPDPDDPSQLDDLDRDAATQTDTHAGDPEDDDEVRGFQ